MKRILLLIFVALATNNILLGQGQFTTQGNDFWLTYGANYTYTSASPVLQIRVVAAENTQVTLTFTNSSSLNTTVNVSAGQVYTRTLSATEKAALYNNATGTSSRSLHVTSNKNIALFAINLMQHTTDATNVLPVTNLGTDYYHLTYQAVSGTGGDGYCIIATENSTQVTDAGTVVATLSRGQVYSRYFGNVNYTGRHITTSKPVAYFTTTSCVNVPSNAGYCDCLFQQLVPVPSWGNRFLVPVTNRGRDRVRIVASQNSTTVTYTTTAAGATTTTTLNAGGYVEIEINQTNNGCYIIASKPVAVGSFLMGSSNFSLGAAVRGDPAFAWVPPIEQAVAHTLIAPFIAVGTSVLAVHYALIVTPTSTRNTTTVSISGGTPQALSGGSWTTNTASGYSYYSMPLPSNTTYEFQNSSGLTILGYGLGEDESYYYMAAASARQLDPAFYVNDLHFQDINGQSICDAPLVFRASIQYPLGNAAGRLKWYIDNVEQTSNPNARDQNTWTMPKGRLLGTHTIKLTITDSYNNTKDVITTFTVLAIPVAIPSGNVSAAAICSGTAPTVTVSGTSSSLTYRVFTAATGGTQVGSLAGNGGTINIPCTGNLSTSTTYYVESYNGVCPSTPRTAVTVNVVQRPTVPTLTAAATCNGSNPVIHLATSVSGVNYNVYTANSGGTNVGTAAGTGSAIDITLSTTPSTATTYYVEAALGSCISTGRSSVSVTVNAKPSITSSNISKTDVSCYGGSTGSITVTASGVNAYSKDNGSTWQSGNTFSGLTAGTYQVRVRTSAGCVSDAVSTTISQPTELTLSLSSFTDVLCNGGNGTITVTASGGTAAYKYKLGTGSYGNGNTFTVAAGTYSVTVQDAKGCEKTLSNIAVSQPAALTLQTPSVTPVSCNGGNDGTITIEASGGTGTGTYQYKLGTGSYGTGNTFTVTAGTYSVTVRDANNCEKALTGIVVSQPAALTLQTPSVTHVLCNGGNGTITIEASGGTAPYQYILDSGAPQDSKTFTVVAGTYSVTVRDKNNCEKTLNNIVVSQPAALTLQTPSVTHVLCNGGNGTITIEASGGTAPYQYILDSGAPQSSKTFTVVAGTYSVTVKDKNNCEKTLSDIVVSQPAAALSTAITATDLSCHSGVWDGKIEVVASGGTSPYTYSNDGGTYYQNNGTFADLPIGAYGIVVKDANGCVTAMETVHVSQPPALAIPAPAVSSVSCNGGDNGIITVSGVSGGTLPYQYSFDGGANYGSENSKSGLSVGTYYIRVKDGHSCVSSSITVTVDEPGVLLTPADVSAAVACPNLPATVTIANTHTGVYYEIYDAATGGDLKASTLGDGTSQNVDIGVISETATFYIQTVSGSCISVSRVPVTVQVRATTLNYPDIRIEVCPGSSNVNLSKYIDTLDLMSLSWTGPAMPAINPVTGIIGSVPSTQSVYTFIYSASSHCVASVSRKVYLHVAGDRKVFAPRDTVAVCWKYAEVLQVNQMFGIEAAGTWSTVPVLSPAYIHQSASPSPYAGALIFNGKAAYEDGVLTAVTYHGEPARQIEFYYTVPAGDCLGDKAYRVVIVLTPDITK
jgi:hypothetical protein